MDTKHLMDQDISVPAKLAIGGAGIGVGLIDHIVSWAQVISIVGGAVIVMVTLIGMAIKAYKKIF